MQLARRLGIALLAYLALVVAFEAFVVAMGSRHAARGLAAGERYVALVTRGEDGSARTTVVAGVEIDGRLYVAANHWPRAWYERALARPDVELTQAGASSPRRAVPVEGEELARVAARYRLPLVLRALTGFPPRRFLRLDPR